MHNCRAADSIKAEVSSRSDAAPVLWLLLRVNALQSWRRLMSVREQSRLLSLSIGLFIAGYLSLSFLLFRWGLKFLNNFPAMGPLLTERLFFLMFAILFVLLLLSNLVVGYSNFFRSRETHFLISLPVSAQAIFRWKFLESMLLASWAFLFLIAPLLAAYGLTRHVPWHFYLMTPVAIGLFIVLPAVAGAWAALNLARYLDRRAFQVVALVAGCALVVAATVWFRPERMPEDSTETRVLAVLDKLLTRTQFVENFWLPSFWLSNTVMEWAEGAVASAGFFLLVLLSYVLFFGYLSFTRVGKLFYESYSGVQSRESMLARWDWFRRLQRRKGAFTYAKGWPERLLGLSAAPTDVQAILLKDARMFWRDTTQWGQTLVLFGLLGVYIINLRHFSQQLTSPFWIHLVSYLNLGACSLNLATVTTRFVFPQFSLEGKRLWIIGMAPMGLVRVLRAKFWLASRAALVITLGLTWLSGHMLEMPLDRQLYFCLIMATMTFTLAGLATGIGALYPNFREDNPTKIVSGFGGTLCLVLSFLYIVGSIALLAVASPWGWHGRVFLPLIFIGWGGFALLSVLIGWVPFRLGLRRVETVEI